MPGAVDRDRDRDVVCPPPLVSAIPKELHNRTNVVDAQRREVLSRVTAAGWCSGFEAKEVSLLTRHFRRILIKVCLMYVCIGQYQLVEALRYRPVRLVAQLFEVLSHNPEGRGFDCRSRHWPFLCMYILDSTNWLRHCATGP